MTVENAIDVLRKAGLRDTQSRRMVVEALRKAGKPLSPLAIRKAIATKGQAINQVTVYRILEVLEEHKMLHRHPCSGDVTFCTMPGQTGHHGFLHCVSCGKVDEFASEELCRAEGEVAKRAGFTAHNHVSELIGICAKCTA